MRAAASALNWTQRRMVEIRHSGRIPRSAMNDIIETVCDAQFNPVDIRTRNVAQLERELGKAFSEGDILEYDLHRLDDGKQDLRMYTRRLRNVIGELTRDTRFDGHMAMGFEPTYEADGERSFGPAAGGVWFQLTAGTIQVGNVLLAIVLFIDGSYIKQHISVKPVYRKYCTMHVPQFVANLTISDIFSDLIEY